MSPAGGATEKHQIAEKQGPEFENGVACQNALSSIRKDHDDNSFIKFLLRQNAVIFRRSVIIILLSYCQRVCCLIINKAPGKYLPGALFIIIIFFQNLTVGADGDDLPGDDLPLCQLRRCSDRLFHTASKRVLPCGRQ